MHAVELSIIRQITRIQHYIERATNLAPCLIFPQSSENDRQSALIDTVLGDNGPQQKHFSKTVWFNQLAGDLHNIKQKTKYFEHHRSRASDMRILHRTTRFEKLSEK